MRYVAICQSFLVEIVFCPRLVDASIHRTSHCTMLYYEKEFNLMNPPFASVLR